jgi:hypothetical protein
LIAKLAALRSNCLPVPALILVWAMLEGLRVSVRGCDWPAVEVIQHVHQILRFACHRVAADVHLRVERPYRHIALEGVIEVSLLLELKDSPVSHKERSMQDIWAYGQVARQENDGQKITSALLEASIDFVQARISSEAIVEPWVREADADQYTLSFDDVSHYDAEGLL